MVGHILAAGNIELSINHYSCRPDVPRGAVSQPLPGIDPGIINMKKSGKSLGETDDRASDVNLAINNPRYSLGAVCRHFGNRWGIEAGLGGSRPDSITLD